MPMPNHSLWLIIPAAGVGKRLNADLPKQYIVIDDRSVIEHTLSPFIAYPHIQQIIVVVSNADTHWQKIQTSFTQVKFVTVPVGKERCFSVYQGLLSLQSLAAADDWVLVHDAVRPCISSQDIDRLVVSLQHHTVGGLLGVPVRDTLKRVNTNGDVIATIARENIWQAQTPQMFRYGILMQAMKAAIEQDRMVTDEASAIELIGQHPVMVEGTADNIKITYPEDIQRAKYYLTSLHNLQQRKLL